MTKRRPSSLMRRLSRLKSRLIIILCVLLCVLAFLRLVLRSESNLQSSFPSTPRRSRGFIDAQFVGPPKVAFLFLVRQDLPLDFLWGTFFKNGDAAKFSIYIHSEPGFVLDETTTRSAFFFGRQLNNSIQVVWGESSMIEAEQLLFEEALYDPANQRFVLLSDSCVPLHNFSYIYNYIMSSPNSFVDSFIDVKGRRYDPKMSPTIPKERWRKGSQWITLVRKHAEIVVDDDTVFPLFRKFCKRWPPTPLSFRRRLLAINWTSKLPLSIFQKHRNCIPDEHYVQTLLAISGLDNELEQRGVTYTLWNQSTIKGKKKSWHPLTFDYADAAPQKLKEIKEAMRKDALERMREPSLNLKGFLQSAYVHPVFKGADDSDSDGAAEELEVEPAVVPTKRQSQRNTPVPSKYSGSVWSSEAEDVLMIQP